MPDGLDFNDAAALMHAGTCAWIALVETAAIAPGSRVLVHGGAGAIGGMAVQIARHMGADVTATCRAANADYARALGATMGLGEGASCATVSTLAADLGNSMTPAMMRIWKRSRTHSEAPI